MFDPDASVFVLFLWGHCYYHSTYLNVLCFSWHEGFVTLNLQQWLLCIGLKLSFLIFKMYLYWKHRMEKKDWNLHVECWGQYTIQWYASCNHCRPSMRFLSHIETTPRTERLSPSRSFRHSSFKNSTTLLATMSDKSLSLCVTTSRIHSAMSRSRTSLPLRWLSHYLSHPWILIEWVLLLSPTLILQHLK